MIGNPRSIQVAATLAALLVLLVACSPAAPAQPAATQAPAAAATQAPAQQAAAGEILVGVPVPLTGADAKMGEDISNGIKMAFEEVNAAGGVKGQKLTMAVEDDACDPQVSVSAANKLMARKVVAVVGHYCSGAALPATTVYHNAGVPVILVASTATRITQQGYPEVFRIIAANPHEGRMVAQWAKDNGKKRIGLIHDNTAYAKDLAEQTQAAAQQLGGMEVVFFEAITRGEKDFKPVLTSLKAANPDMTFFTGYYPEGGIIAKQFKELAVPGILTVGDANNDVTFIQIAGKDAEGVLVADSEVSKNPDWEQRYKAKFNVDPGPYSNFAYDGAMVLVDALKRASSTSGPDLVKALKETKYTGLTGEKEFDAQGEIKKGNYRWLVVKEGKFEPLKG